MNLARKPGNAAIEYMIENRDDLVGRYCRNAASFSVYYIHAVAPDWLVLRRCKAGDQGDPDGPLHHHDWQQFARDYNVLPAPRGDAV